ncbi:dihydroneopterin triphosphate 2'-epimerase [Shewanella psychropiezotolerans]|uniref:Dihydroneopterin triphosphate 2'-epimerase n=1 Tax=Shewanella psychropiezotolerans TaxID=2593655 RepID=A0ABX5WX33_9GAMM|nr:MULTISPECIES: dihydroneopterin triphosphate 2'-epimerase [Shewanella]MPY26012.1 dihydroneopterin triphosphate 2'-epimerase [Shewanella sp. YLB-07]QDO83614.1 dihydroneopterin triphosphate 2'-epimerase [Shewanella psychropiezotolerans]
MRPEIAIIRIKNLRLRTFIGIKDDEIQNKQDILINTEIHYCANKARNSDNMDDALNYRTITKKIIELVEHNRFNLLENLTGQVLNIASDHAWVEFASVEIDKPHALRFADSVSLSLCYSKNNKM